MALFEAIAEKKAKIRDKEDRKLPLSPSRTCTGVV
jgi:hypothetical protein